MNWPSNVAEVSLDTYKHHHIETLLYLLCLCPCLDLGLFMSYLCRIYVVSMSYLVFISIFIFIMINQIVSWEQPRFFALHVLVIARYRVQDNKNFPNFS